MDRLEGGRLCLNPSASLITATITALTLPISLFYFISFSLFILHPSPAHAFFSLHSPFSSQLFVFSLSPTPLSFISESILYLCSSLISLPPHLFLSPQRLPAVDYHTSKELGFLSPVGPISCQIEHQSICRVSTGSITPVNPRAGIYVCVVDQRFVLKCVVMILFTGLAEITVMCVTKDSPLLCLHPAI